METLEIGVRKVFTDVTLEVVIAQDCSCNGCWFRNQETPCCVHPYGKIMGPCSLDYRYDGKSVIFKEIKGKEIV